jgi:hypothetical protein
MGTFKVIFFVSLDRMSTSLGNICEYAGTKSTSSKVKPSPINLVELVAGDFFMIAMCKDKRKIIAAKRPQ